MKIKIIVAGLLANSITGSFIGLFKKSVRVFGKLQIDISSPQVSNVMKAYLFWGMYESAEARCIGKYVNPQLPVIELGASIGVITCLISARKPTKHISVEANPYLVDLIEHNIKINKLAQPIILNRAISYSNSEDIDFAISKDNTGSSIAGKNSLYNCQTVKVKTITLQAIVKEYNLDEYQIVSDIEGAEVLMFWNESAEVLDKCKLMIIELHNTDLLGSQIKIEDIRQHLVFKLGFEQLHADGDVYVFKK